MLERFKQREELFCVEVAAERCSLERILTIGSHGWLSRLALTIGWE